MRSRSTPPGSATPPPDDVAGARLGLAAGAVCVALVGIDLRPGIVSVGPLLVAIREQFGLSHAAAALLTAIPDVLMGVLALIAPALVRRLGRDRVILTALVLLSLATGARALSGSAIALFLSTAGIGAGIAVAGTLIGGFVKACFPHRAPFVLGIYTAALSLGSTLAASVTGPVASRTADWRPAAGMWAMPGLLAIAAWLFVALREGRGSIVPPRRHRLPFTSGKAWLIALFFAAQNFLFYALVSWLAALYRERGFDAGMAGLVLASFTGCFFIANLVAGTLSRNHDRRLFLAGFAGLALLGLAGLASAPVAAPFLLVPTIAVGLGGCFTLGMTLPLDNTGDADQANAWGALMTLVAYLIASTGPVLVGGLRDATGRFDESLWLLASVAATMLGVTPFLRPRREHEIILDGQPRAPIGQDRSRSSAH